MDADVGTGSLFLGICGVGGGPFVFSLHGHTGRMASMNCAASPTEAKLT